ncbi:hypothetical protein LSTR_LSTR010733 [Laodelphax striatellus]|uniref:CRAL-TRIO domain-containing protein n=1 Tax=Laodelphax striatellus TaxID=195883 RepID=A0A482XRJ1_LAOST|nr:hypothetical protein LSTR_LSTR010733 [Laodelphax striatellus]
MEREDAVNQLRNLVSGEPDLNVGEDDDRILLRYLAYTKFDVEKAFEKMKMIYKNKHTYSEWYATERTENQDFVLSRHIHTMIEPRDSQGRRIYIVQLGNIVVSDHQAHEMSQVDDIWLEAVMDEPETQKNGIVFIVDMKGLSWKFMKYFTPTNVKIGSMKAETIPLHSIQFHVINTGMLLNGMVSLVFPLLSTATKESIFFHKSSLESLHKHINPESLPKEYGGTLPPLDYDKNIDIFLKKNNTRLLELLKYGYSTAAAK